MQRAFLRPRVVHAVNRRPRQLARRRLQRSAHSLWSRYGLQVVVGTSLRHERVASVTSSTCGMRIPIYWESRRSISGQTIRVFAPFYLIGSRQFITLLTFPALVCRIKFANWLHLLDLPSFRPSFSPCPPSPSSSPPPSPLPLPSHTGNEHGVLGIRI